MRIIESEAEKTLNWKFNLQETVDLPTRFHKIKPMMVCLSDDEKFMNETGKI